MKRKQRSVGLLRRFIKRLSWRAVCPPSSVPRVTEGVRSTISATSLASEPASRWMAGTSPAMTKRVERITNPARLTRIAKANSTRGPSASRARWRRYRCPGFHRLELSGGFTRSASSPLAGASAGQASGRSCLRRAVSIALRSPAVPRDLRSGSKSRSKSQPAQRQYGLPNTRAGL